MKIGQTIVQLTISLTCTAWIWLTIGVLKQPINPLWYCIGGLSTSIALLYFYYLAESRRNDRSVKLDFLIKAIESIGRTFDNLSGSFRNEALDEEAKAKLVHDLHNAVETAKGIAAAVES